MPDRALSSGLTLPPCMALQIARETSARVQSAVRTVRVRRGAAAFLDALLALTIALVPAALALPLGAAVQSRVFGLGLLGGTAYLLLRDAIPYAAWGARSLGKRWLGVRPYTVSGGEIDWRTSAKRNATVAAAFGIPAVTYLLGGFRGLPFGEVLLYAALALAVVEAVLVVADREGARIGDRWAGTRVTEARA